MKSLKFYRVITAIAMMLIGWLPSLAHGFEVNGIFYDKINSSTVEVTYKGDTWYSYSDEYIGEVVIPSSVNYNGTTYSVTSIGWRAFADCTSLTSIEIPNSVTSIGDYAFSWCDSLTEIKCHATTPPTIESYTFSNYDADLYVPAGCISAYQSAIYWRNFRNIKFVPEFEEGMAFEYGGLTYKVTVKGKELAVIASKSGKYSGNVVIPSSVDYYSVTSIGNEAFFYCLSLTSVVIPNSVTSIGNEAFRGCISLTSIQIPNSVTSIGGAAFYDCESLTSIQIPNSVTSIGGAAFYDCESLTSVVIPNSVTSIENESFWGCTSLTNVVIGNSVTSIGYAAFYECESLKSIEIPNSVTSIGDDAFRDCYSLTGIEIPNSVTSIGDDTFSYCNSLTSIQIPNSVTSIGDEAFWVCSSLTSVVIGNSVTSIGDAAFGHCYSLTGIEIPNSVTSIGDAVFAYCSGLTTVVVDSGNTKYDSRNGCNAIIETASNTLIAGCKNTIIPNSVTSIGGYAFAYCSNLTSIEIPNSVTSIGDYAFYYCSNLTKITCWATTPPTIESDTFSNWSADLYVPTGCISAYQSAIYWKNFNIKEIYALSTSIALNKTSASLKATETLTLVATVLPENATDKSVTWKSSNEAVATVDANGVVIAIALGEAVITATTTDGTNLSATCKVTVVPTLAETITLDKTEISLEATETATLIVIVLPELATDKSVEWSSSNESVATIDANGLVTAIALGEAVITATTTDGTNLSATCKVTVVPTLAESITLDKTEISIEATETATLVATVLPELTTNKSVTWTSSNEAVATVDANGVVTAIALGEATITATTTDGSNFSDTCKVTVVATLAETITLDKTEISIEATETATLVATVLPELTTNKSVEWTSSNEAVATVDANGVVTAIALGEAIITAIATDGSGATATCQVTVIPTLAMSIELDKTEVSAEEKSDLQLTATILPEHTTNKEVAWSSSYKWVAKVDNTGLVTMYSAGEVIITATTTDGSNLSATCRINVYSGIDGVNGDNVIVATIGDNILVKDAPLGSNVRVYTADGAMIATEIVTDGSVVIEAPIKGIYVVAIDGKSFKVMVK